MNMKKMSFLLVVFILSCNAILLFSVYYSKDSKISMVDVNDLTESIRKQWTTLSPDQLPGLNYGLDYVVLDDNNEMLAATRSGLNHDLNKAISNRDTIIDIKSEDVVLGKLIIYNDTNEQWYHYKIELVTFTMIAISLMAIFSFLYSFYINKTILHPFQKLKTFAKLVSEGNLDLPLNMDKGNHFGAFTESFDLMREELKKSRENERKANQSKKELIASLSHDIKTPVASIKAVSEIMQAKTTNEHERKQLEIINSKADQINTLITNMFNATLEELQELKVSVREETSKIIYDFIQEVDYHMQVTLTEQAECIVWMDPLRLSQVIDNIISNSYKYAGTSISVAFKIIGNYLEVSIKDYGLGVSNDELPLLFNKFFRAKNSIGKNGTGLGLYISKYLMNQMNGDLVCENTLDGFVVRIKLLIA